jgi:hypothetical protein
MNATPHEWARWCTDPHVGSTKVNAMITDLQPSACHAVRRNDTAAADHFGESVAVWDDIAVVGVPRDTGNRGSAWVFRFDGLTWNQDQKLLPRDPGAADDYFGRSVAASGVDTAGVGAYYDDDNGLNSGSAYVFHFDGST